MEEQTTVPEKKEIEQVPLPTEWSYYSACPIFWHFKGEKKIRFGYTILRFFPFYFLILLSALVYLYWYNFAYPYLSESLKSKTFPILTICFILAMINYTLTHFVNPGIIPWNWSETRRTRYSSNEIKSGIATTPEQKQWGKDHELPPRAFFSYSYGFAVLRAEHICFFADQWVGIHNLKYFLLATMYGSIYLIYVFITSYIAYHEDPTFSFKKLWLYLLAFCTTGLFASYHIQQLVLGVKRIVENYTYVESRFGFPNVYNRGVIKNFEEIFGPVFLLPLWFLPIPLKGTKNGYDYPQPPAEILENNDDVSLQNKVI